MSDPTRDPIAAARRFYDRLTTAVAQRRAGVPKRVSPTWLRAAADYLERYA